MELKDALAIVIDLAKGNLTGTIYMDTVLKKDSDKQWEAIEEVESHLRDLRMIC